MTAYYRETEAVLPKRAWPSRRRQAVVMLALLGFLAGCATTSPSASIGRVDSRADLAGHRVEVTRVYEHEVKTEQGNQWQRVEYGWDYTDAVAYELTTDLEGNRLAFRQLPGQVLRATEREQQVAGDLVRRHPGLAEAAATPGAIFHSGFILMERDHPHCHLGSRCVYVLVVTDNGNNKIVQAIVDLQTAQVVDPYFDPDMIGSPRQPRGMR
jgi:hypothetical protein